MHWHDVFQWWPVIFGSGAGGVIGTLAHPVTRPWYRRLYLALFNPSELFTENATLTRRLAESDRRADFWEESHGDIARQLGDLQIRFEQIRSVAQSALDEVAALRAKAQHHQDLLLDLSTDRETLLIWGRSMAAIIGPSAPAEPKLRNSNYNVMAPLSDTP